MKSCLIFDFDGTMVQSKSLAIQVFNELGGKYGGRKIEDDEIAKLSDMSIPDRLKALKVPIYRLPALLVEGKKEYKNAIVHLEPVAGIRDVLHKLKAKGYILGILSSNTKENIEYFLEHHQLKYFDFIHSASNLFGKHKAITSMGRKNEIKLDEIIYIGDELRDVEACKKIKVTVIAVTWGWDSPELLKDAAPNFICHTPLELEKLILTM